MDSMRYLENESFEVFFAGKMDEKFILDNSDFAQCINIDMNRGVNIYNSIKSIFELYKLFKKERFDIIQYSTPNASLYSSIAGKLAGVPVRLYCQWGLRYVSMHGFKRVIFKYLETITCNFSTWIEPDSNGNLNLCRQEGLYSEENSSVVWNGSASGVNLQKFDINKKATWRNELRNKFNIDENSFVFGFVGRVDKDKGFNELLEAYRQIESADTILIIVGMEDKVDTIDKTLYEYSKNSKTIIYTGLVNDAEKFFSVMDCLVLPSYREGFGSVVIEAGAMAVPVIVTDIPGPTEAMIEGVTGLVIKKEDVNSLISAFNRIMRNKGVAKEMGKSGYNFVKSKFDSKILYQHILKDRNRLINLVRGD